MPTPFTLNTWLEDLGNSKIEESYLIENYPLTNANDYYVEPAYWPVIFQRFPTESWRTAVASWMAHDFMNIRKDHVTLEEQLSMLSQYLPCIKYAYPYLQENYYDDSYNNSYADILDITVSLLKTGVSSSTRANYVSIVLAPLLSKSDLIGNVLEVLQDDEWGDFPYEIPTISRIFEAALNDARTSPGTLGEFVLCRAAFRTGKTHRLSDDLGSPDSDIVYSAFKKIENVISIGKDNRFWRVYMLGWYDTNLLKEMRDGHFDVLAESATYIKNNLSSDEQILWMRLTNTLEGEGHKHLMPWVKLSGLPIKNGPRTTLIDLWKELRPEWRPHHEIWEALGLEGNEWIDAGVAVDEKKLNVSSSLPALPDNTAFD